MRRGRDSVRTGVGREKRRTSASIHTNCFLGGARPVAGSIPCAKGRMAHNSRLASWEPATPASFDAAPLGTYPQGWRLFLSYFCALLHFLKPYSQWCRAFVAANSLVHVEQHGRVFTYDPTPYNPYTIQFFKVLRVSSFSTGKKRSYGGSSHTRLTTAVQTAWLAAGSSPILSCIIIPSCITCIRCKEALQQARNPS
jgi:hypothetical protein